MGFSLRNVGKKIEDVLGGVERQVNPFDNGATYKNPNPAPRAPAPAAPSSGLIRTPGGNQQFAAPGSSSWNSATTSMWGNQNNNTTPQNTTFWQGQPQVSKPTTSTPWTKQRLLDDLRKSGEAVGLGAARSGVGTAQGVSGLYDLVTPGKGTNRFSQKLDRGAKFIDDTATADGVNNPLYHGAQAATDALQLAIGSGEVNLATKAATKVPKVAEIAAKAAPYVEKAGKAVDKFIPAEDAIGKVAQGIVHNTVTPKALAANAGMTANYTGQNASKGRKTTAKEVATNFGEGELLGAANGIAEPIAKAAGKKVAQAARNESNRWASVVPKREAVQHVFGDHAVKEIDDSANALRNAFDAQRTAKASGDEQLMQVANAHVAAARDHYLATNQKWYTDAEAPKAPTKAPTSSQAGFIMGPEASPVARAIAKPFRDDATGRRLYEGDDSKMKFQDNYDGIAHLNSGEEVPLGNVIKHDDLFQAYPEMKNIPVVIDHHMPEGTSAAFSEESGKMRLNPDHLTDDDESLRSIIHEATHWIQAKEDLPRGGGAETGVLGRDEIGRQLGEMQQNPAVSNFLERSRGMVKEAKSQGLSQQETNTALRLLEHSAGPEVKQFLDLAKKSKELKNMTPTDLYARLHGEAYARVVENRKDLTPAQRAESHPLDSLDVPEKQIITEHEDAHKRLQKQLDDWEFEDEQYRKKLPDAEGAVSRPNSDNLVRSLQRGLVDSDQPIIDAMRAVDKRMGIGSNGDHLSREDRFHYNSNMQRSSHAVANQFFENSENIHNAFSGLGRKEAKAFDEYASARTELATAKTRGKGFKTSTSREELQKVVDSASPEMQKRFEALNAHYKELAQVARDAGVIDGKKLAQYKANNDYVRLQRDMEDLVQRFPAQGNSIGLRSTITGQKRHGSQRQVLPAGETAAWYTQQIFREARKNQTGLATVAALKEGGLATRVPSTKAAHANILPVKRNGKQEFWRVPADVKEAAMNINPVQLGPVLKIISAPGRLVRAGITGLNPVFIARNVVKDQIDSSVNSEALAYTHDPRNIFSGLLNATGDALGVNKNPLYDEFLKHVGETTSYDFTRNQKNARQVIDRARGGVGTSVVQHIKAPIRSLEDLASITERSTRFQNFKGGYEAGIKRGLTPEQAYEYGAIQAWRNSVDFSRAGSFGRVINQVIPYWNPATQGARQMVRTFRNHPVKGPVTALATIGVPIIAATAWNLSDPETAAVYKNIPEYEKNNNIVIVPPGTKQNEDGTYDVWKIPLPPGIGSLFQPGRRALESFHDKDHVKGGEIAGDILSSVSGPVNFQNGVSGFAGSFTPQWAKPFVQAYANRDLFSGKKTVPDYMTNAKDENGNAVKPEQMTYQRDGKPSGSGTAQQIADKLHVSPLIVEKFIKDTGGTVGLELLNATDTAQAKAGTVAKNRVGGQSVPAGFKRSFAQADGIVNNNKSDGAKYFDQVTEATKGLNSAEQAAYQALHPSKSNFLGQTQYEKDAAYNPAAKVDIYNRFPKVFEADKKLDAMQQKQGKPGNPFFTLSDQQRKVLLEKQELPPGATDPQLSNVSKEQWYQDYQAANSDYYDKVNAELQKQGKSLSTTDNPYPAASKDLSNILTQYSSLPKGTGARSSWIKANPDAWSQMQNHYAALDDWTNKQRGKRGLDPTAGNTATTGGSSGSGSSSSSGSKYTVRSKSGSSSYKGPFDSFAKTDNFAVSRSADKIFKPAITNKKPGKVDGKFKVTTAKVKKPKVSFKKA